MNEPERAYDPLGDPTDGHIFSRAIIDTIHEPLIVLDSNLMVITASKSFYKKFGQTFESARGKHFYEMGGGLWNIPALRKLLEQVIPEQRAVKGYEVEHVFPVFGRRTLVVNAQEIFFEDGAKKMLLLSFFDITESRSLEAEKELLLSQKDLLLKEMRHRIANSLQIIASILMIRAASVSSDESKSHLQDAHDRIMSVATVQQQLDPIEKGGEIEVADYLTKLCKSLSRSMIGGRKPITIEVLATEGHVSSDTAIAFGLLTTELVINSLKHAFKEGQSGTITVAYTSTKSGWTLSVGDDGVGQGDDIKGEQGGLGTSIVGALANQLHAIIRTNNSPNGTTVTITHVSVDIS